MSGKKKIIKWGIKLALMLLVLILLLNLTVFLLKKYTNHGIEVTVPDLIGMKVDEAVLFLSEKPFTLVVIDSVYDMTAPKGVILDQSPFVNTSVKKNRKIYLTINALSVKQVALPELKDVSIVQARATLKSKRLRVGRVEEELSDCEGCVIRYMYKSVSKHKGDKVPQNSAIDLVIGKLGAYIEEDSLAQEIVIENENKADEE